MQRWDDVEARTVIPGFHGRFIHSERMTFTLWRIDAGAVLPRHSHPHEQVVQVRSGELEITVDGMPHRLGPGSILVIPPDAVHEGRALSEVTVLDTFAPVREDYRTGSGPNVLNAAGDGTKA